MPVTENQATEENKYAATSWGSENGLGGLHDLEMPSGQLAQVRRPGPQGLITAGVIQSMDSLTGIVKNDLIPAAEGKPKVDASKVLKDPKALAEMTHMIDKIVCHCVVQPKVEMTPNDVTRRKPGVVYADMIDLTDKVFIMNFGMGGSKDLERFRQESEAAVGGVDSVEESPDSPE